MKRKLLFLLFIVFGFAESQAQGDVVVTNTNYQSAFIPGYPTVYTVTVTNSGPGDADNTVVSNPIPAGITQFSWVGDNGSSGTDVALNDVIAFFASGDTVTYTITLFVPAGYSGVLTSTATAVVPAGDPNLANNTASDADVAPAPASADIVVFKTDNDLNYTAGQTQTYTVILTNHGPAAATNVTIQDLVPAGVNAALVSWTGDNSTSGTGNLNDAIPNMSVGDTIIYTVTMPIPNDFDQNTNLVNTVTTTSGTPDPNPLCQGCVDTDTPDPKADIVVLKTNGQTQYLVDEETTYTITVTNNGPSEAVNVEVTDNMPPGISSMIWSSSLGTDGTGNMLETIPVLAVGQTVTYTVTIDVPLGYNLAFVNLTNTVSVTSDTPDPVPLCPGCSDTDTPRPRWVTVDTTTYTIPELVEDILIDSDCANVSNFTWQAGAGANIGVGYFHKNNSNFPLKSGAVIRCGRAKACEGPFDDNETSTIGSGLPDTNSIGYNADPQDLHGVSVDNGNPGSINDVSYIQFNFLPLTDNFSFDFLFASNEYGTFQCTFGDVFAFILKNTVTGVISNLAVIPSTTTPVSVTSIRDTAYNGGCGSVNPQFFDVFNQGTPANAAIDMRGQTVQMTASATVVPNNLYSIKLVIGDYQDTAYDSAVFIEAGSFNVGQADLGDDMLVNSGTAGCYGSSMTLDTELDPNVYDFEWTLDGGVLPQTTPAITVTEEGEYCVRAYTGTCEQIDCIIVEFRDPVIPPAQAPTEVTACTGQNFDLTDIEPDMFGTLNPANYDIGYYHTQFQAENEISPIGPITNYVGIEGEIVWVKVLETNSGFDCFVVFPFTLHYENCGTANDPPDLAVCDDVSNDDVAVFDLTTQIDDVLGSNAPADYVITFHLTQIAADAGTGDLSGLATYQNTSNPQTIYVRMESVSDPLVYSTVFFTLTVHDQPATPNPSDVSACSDVGYTLPALPAGSTYHSAAGGDASTIIAAGTLYNTPGTTTIYIFAQSGTTPNCTAEGSFDVTIIQTPPTPNPANVAVCSADGYQLPVLPAGQTYHTASGGSALTQVAAGTIYDTANTTTTLYIFAQSGTVPNCTREGSFIITVHPTPATPNPANVAVCSDAGYVLPALPAGSTYHSAPGGAATTLIAAGSNIDDIGANTIYIFAQSGTTPNCTAEGDFVVTVYETPTAINPADVSVCSDTGYILPALPAGSTYHDAPGGLPADEIAAGTNINSVGTNTIYIFSQTGTIPNCTAEGNFVVTVYQAPTAINPADVSVCSVDGYILPVLPAGSTYHNAPGGAASTIIAAGTNINTVGTNTIYVYSQTNTTPNCTAEGDFVVTVHQTPVTPNPVDVTVCSIDGYVLPILPAGQTYHSAAGGSSATEITAGSVYNTAGTYVIYVYAQSGTIPNCAEEDSFTITVNQTPTATEPADVIVCEANGYILPALPANSTYHSAAGGSSATVIAPGTNINTVGLNTIYVYSQTNTTPNCTAEGDFIVDVRETPVADAPSNVVACDSYTLPALNVGDYFDGPNGTGNAYFAGDVITAAHTTMYVYAQTGTTPNCTDQNTFDIDIFYSPAIVHPDDIRVCDDNNDGFSCLFVLSDRDAQITGGNASLSVTYHETATDATTGANPIAGVGGYCNIVSGTQVIHVRVFDAAAPACYSVETLTLHVDPVPVPNPSIPDYRLCDVNTPGDQAEVFDLTSMAGTILNGQANVTITYYQTNADALAQANAIADPSAYTNISNPQQICVRLENNASGCFAVACFNIGVDPLPGVSPSTMNACGTSGGVASFNLTTQDLTVSNGVPGMGVVYYENQSDALAGNGDTIPNPTAYPNLLGNPQTVYALVRNNATGCFAVTTVTLNVSQGPPANTPSPLEVCDPNNDCFAPFNLNDALVDIFGAPAPPAGVGVSFHETLTDAQNGQTPIGNPGSYTNIVMCDQVLYVSVVYDATGCRTVVELALHVNLTPVATEIDALQVCDDDTDGIGTFDLNAAIPAILGGLDPGQHTVTFHASLADAQAPAGEITNVLGYHNTTPFAQTIWVRVEDNATGCFDVVELGLVVNRKPLLPPTPTGAAVPYSKCDYNNPGDEIEEFDLSSQVPGILNGQAGVTVTFHETQADALAPANALPNLYLNEDNAQTLWVRMQDQLTGCFVLTTLDLRVEPLPELIPPPAADLTQCDQDGDGFALFDLQALTANMLQGAPNIDITFHETLTDAQNGANPKASPYLNIVAYLQPMYVRAEDTLTGCWSVMMIELRAIGSPVVVPLEDISQCDTDTDGQDGFSSFDLTAQEQLILDSQTGTAADYQVSYHLSQSDADQGIAPITGAWSFTNTVAFDQVIYVRVEEISSGCWNVGSFSIHVDAPLALVTPPQLTICDDGPTSALPKAEFDLTIRNADILGTAVNHTVSYYETQADALADTNAIADPGAYTNIANAQTLFVAVKGPAPSFCRSFTTLTIRVLPLPVPLTADIPLIEACDDDPALVGSEIVDLTQNEAYIRDNDPQLGFEYYTTPAAAHAGDNTAPEFIADPANHQMASGTVYIRVERTSEADYQGGFCYVVVEQPVVINPLPQLVAAEALGCDTSGTGANTYGFTLSDYNDLLLLGGQDPGDFTFAHYPSLADAQAGTGQLSDSYTGTEGEVLTVRVTDNQTGCIAYVELTLRVAAGAFATDATATPVCDTDSDGLMQVDLTQFDATVLNGQDPLQFTVAYFASQEDAEDNAGALASPHNMATGVVYAVVTNTTTGCRSEAAMVTIDIEPLVDIVIESATSGDVICVDFLTGDLISGLTLESQLPDDGTYQFQWALGGVDIPGATASTYTIADPAGFGDYTVRATTALGCISSSATFTVLQSGPAVVPPGTTGYTVSNAFGQDQTITVAVQGYGTYHYQLDNGPILDNGGVFTDVPPGVHTVTVYDMEGNGNVHCGEITIGGIMTIDYPKFFTPNGDGFNDTWLITGLDDSAKIYIFDRYGKLVKQIAANGLGWDGTYNGQPMPSTDYWFTVEYNEPNSNAVITKEFKAHFSLKR